MAIFLIIPFSSFTGVTTTKRGSASQRITIILARNLVVWIFFTSVPLRHDSVSGKPLYDESFTLLQLFGFILLALGILLFNEILVLPWFGLNQHTKVEIMKRLRANTTNLSEEISTPNNTIGFNRHLLIQRSSTIDLSTQQ